MRTKIKIAILVFVALVCFELKFNAQDPNQEGLIAYYPFNGNANDESGNNQHGTINGAFLTTDRFGATSSAFYFNGSGYIVIPENGALFNVNKDGYSVSFWTYIDDNQVNSYARLMGYGGYGDNGWEVWYNEGNLVSTFQFAVSNSNCSRYTSVNESRWIHYTMVYDNENLKVYRDGGLMGYTHCPDYQPASGFDFVIGVPSDDLKGGFVGKIDDIRIYERALTELEIARMSGNESAISAAEKGTLFYSDFEHGSLTPVQMGYVIDSGDGNVFVTKNPEKDSVNNSEFVMVARTQRSNAGGHSRAEYRLRDRVETKNKKHTYQWMVYFPEDYLKDIDLIRSGWQVISQFVSAPCERYGTDEYASFQRSICYNGGIFNDIEISQATRSKYGFRYRALPNCKIIEYTYPRGEWIKFTYEIFWTTESNGYYSLWANENYLGGAEDVRTLPNGWLEGECDIRWKVGLYDSWYDQDIDSVYYYIDNMEVYVDKDIEDVCKGCVNPCDTTNLMISAVVIPDTNKQSIGSIDLTINGGSEPYSYLWTNGSTTQDIENIPADTYSVVVMDRYLCSIDQEFIVEEVDIQINSPPIINAIYSSEVFNGSVNSIDASNSFDPEGSILDFAWTFPEYVVVKNNSSPVLEYLVQGVSKEEFTIFNLNVNDGVVTQTKQLSIALKPYHPESKRLPVKEITASSYYDQNYPENVVDNNSETFWQSIVNNEWLGIQTSYEAKFSHFEIAFGGDEPDVSVFDVYASTDGENWEVIDRNLKSCGFSNLKHLFVIPVSLSEKYFSYFKLVNTGNATMVSEITIYELEAGASIASPDNKRISRTYPNPVSDKLYLELAHSSIVRIVDMRGIVIQESFIEQGVSQLDVAFKSGVYIVQVISNESRDVFTQKIIIK